MLVSLFSAIIKRITQLHKAERRMSNERAVKGMGDFSICKCRATNREHSRAGANIRYSRQNFMVISGTMLFNRQGICSISFVFRIKSEQPQFSSLILLDLTEVIVMAMICSQLKILSSVRIGYIIIDLLYLNNDNINNNRTFIKCPFPTKDSIR